MCICKVFVYVKCIWGMGEVFVCVYICSVWRLECMCVMYMWCMYSVYDVCVCMNACMDMCVWYVCRVVGLGCVYVCLCVCGCVYARTCHTTNAEVKDNSVESVFSFHLYACFRVQTWVTRLKHRYPLSHLAGPVQPSFCSFSPSMKFLGTF